MAVLDEDAARLLAVMASRGAVDITTMTPQAVRAPLRRVQRPDRPCGA